MFSFRRSSALDVLPCPEKNQQHENFSNFAPCNSYRGVGFTSLICAGNQPVAECPFDSKRQPGDDQPERYFVVTERTAQRRGHAENDDSNDGDGETRREPQAAGGSGWDIDVHSQNVDEPRSKREAGRIKGHGGGETGGGGGP